MNKIAVPVWNGCVSNVFEFSDTVQLITLENDRIVSRRDLHLSRVSDLERTNCLIESRPEVLLCGAISRQFCERIASAGIEVVSLVCGPVDQVINAYLAGDLSRQEFAFPGCKESAGRCTRRRRRRGPCGRHGEGPGIGHGMGHGMGKSMRRGRGMGMATSMGMPLSGSVIGLPENAGPKTHEPQKESLEHRITQPERKCRAVAVVDSEKCTGCGVCIDVCLANAIEVNERAVINTDACTGCSACIWDCPNEAIGIVQIK